jgi:hypothetical protein
LTCHIRQGKGNENLLWKSTGRSDISRPEHNAFFTFRDLITGNVDLKVELYLGKK